MQSPQGMSLLFALLEFELPHHGVYTAATSAASSQARKYTNDLDPGDREKVLRGLYRALYSIIDDYGSPYNRRLNRAIGKALSMAIRAENNKSNPDPDILRLVEMLKPMVTEAIDELAP